MSEKEYYSQAILGENVLQEWAIKNALICKGCASRIDYSLLKFKMNIAAEEMIHA